MRIREEGRGGRGQTLCFGIEENRILWLGNQSNGKNLGRGKRSGIKRRSGEKK